MTKTIASIALLVWLTAGAVHAHLVPLDPSTCALAVGLSSPAGGTAAAVDPPGAGDLLRATYEADSSIARSRVQVCSADPVDPAGRCGAVVPRTFTVGSTPGTIALPAAFTLRLFASGDLFAAAVPVTIVLDGTPHVVPFDLTTGWAAGGAPHFGTPLGADGTFAAIGEGSLAAALPLFGAAALRLELGCTLDPPPDLDQFALGPRLRKVRAKLTPEKVKLTILLDTDVPLPGDFATAPTAIRLGPEGGAVVDVALATIPGSRGRFASADGMLTITPLRRRIGLSYKVVLRGALTAPTPFGTGDSTISVSAGGLVARRAVAFRAKRGGTRLAVREQ
jgi:hypothetical protein